MKRSRDRFAMENILLSHLAKEIGRDDSRPLHVQISDVLREKIEQGELAPGVELPTQSELCEAFGVSKITVCRAIRDLVGEGLLVSRAGRKTRVTESKASPVEKIPSVVHRRNGLHIANIVSYVGHNPGFGEAYNGMQDSLGPNAILHTIRLPFLADAPEEQVDLLDLRAYDGLLMQTNVNLRIVAKSQSLSIPYVLVENDLADRVSHCVVLDYSTGLSEALRRLVDGGRRDIALVTDLPHKYRTWRFLDAFNMARDLMDFETKGEWTIHVANSEEEGYNATRRLLNMTPAPRAIVCSLDKLAKGALTAAIELGLKVPDELAIVGTGQNARPKETPLRLTSIGTKEYRIGELAIKTLLRLIEGDTNVPFRQSVATELVPGETA